MKILIVDDNEGDRKLIVLALQEAGVKFDLIQSSTGEEGVDMARAEHPDIVIMDTNLPGMDGFDACQKIKTMDGISAQVIMMTGAIDAVDAGRARQMGADDYCVKTTDSQPIVDAVKLLIG